MIISAIAICFSILSGYLESYIWHIHTIYVNHYFSKSREIHNALVFIRLFVAIISLSYVNSLSTAIACLGFFFYFHQSSLYYFRNKLNKNVYTSGWNSDGSYSSESYLDRKFPIIKKNRFRVFVLSFSILLLIINNLLW